MSRATLQVFLRAHFLLKMLAVYHGPTVGTHGRPCFPPHVLRGFALVARTLAKALKVAVFVATAFAHRHNVIHLQLLRHPHRAAHAAPVTVARLNACIAHTKRSTTHGTRRAAFPVTHHRDSGRSSSSTSSEASEPTASTTLFASISLLAARLLIALCCMSNPCTNLSIALLCWCSRLLSASNVTISVGSTVAFCSGVVITSILTHAPVH